MKIGEQYDKLKQEYKSRYNTNSFKDNRIGEGSALNEDSKMKLRFKHLQKIRNKTSKFDLNSDSENEFNTLTHGGKKVKEIEDFDDNILSSSDNENDYQNKDNILDINENFNQNLSRKDIIQNLIAKSKADKLEKQKLKLKNLEKIQKLDNNFPNLLGIINKRKKDIIKSNDNYDKFTARFEFATKTKPTNRIKSETEIALERKNELERLEKERLKGKIDKDDELFGELINEEDKTENIGEVGERNQTKRERIQKIITKKDWKIQ